jgi:hypothetical protein
MMAAKQPKVRVSKIAVVLRINRELAQYDEYLHIARRGSHAETALGRYYLGLERPVPTILATNVDVEELARELQVLREWEQIAGE